jgi:hypothetical protein
MDKVIKGGQVAVVISCEYGSGWYSWHGIENLLYDPKIVEILENETNDKFASWEWIRSYAKSLYPTQYFSGDDRLVVKWIPIGAKFRVAEYDGKEHIVLQTEEQWFTA